MFGSRLINNSSSNQIKLQNKIRRCSVGFGVYNVAWTVTLVSLPHILELTRDM